MRTHLFPAIVLAIAALAGCRDLVVDDGVLEALEADSERVVSLEQPFELGYRESVLLADTALRIELTDIVRDNRCPPGGRCEHAGSAAIVLTMRSGALAGRLGLTIPGQVAEPYAAAPRLMYGDFALRLIALTPVPVSGKPRVPERYRSTLHISR